MSFKLRYWAELHSKYKEVFWRVETAEHGYQGSEATVNILCLENFHYINLFTSDPRKFRVSIFRNTKLY